MIPEDDQTSLHLEAQNGNTETVKALLDRGAIIYAQDKFGETPLHIAARYGHTETA